MDIAKLIKKPMGSTKIDYFVTVDGNTVNDVIDYCLEIISKQTYVFFEEGDDAESVLREHLGDGQFEYLLKNHAMGRISPFVIRDEANLDMAFEPECESDEIPHRDEDFTFTIHVLLRPKYKLTSYDPVEVKVPRYRVPEEAIDQRIEQLAQMNTTYKKIDDKGKPIEMGQIVQLDMKCWQHGEELPGLCGSERLLELEYGYMPEAFIDQVVGMKVGETKEFDFESVKPTATDINDTDVFHAKVTVTELKKQLVPKISNAWIEVNLPDAGNVEGLRNQIRSELEAQMEQQTQQDLGAMVDSALSERFDGSIPDELYESAANSIYANMQRGLQQQNKTLDEFMEEQGINQQQLNMQVMIEARGIIRQGLSLDKLFDEKIGEITEQDIEDAYKAFAPGHEEEAKQQFKETGREYAVREVAKRLAAHRWLLETAKVEYEDMELPSQPPQGPTIMRG